MDNNEVDSIRKELTEATTETIVEQIFKKIGLVSPKDKIAKLKEVKDGGGTSVKHFYTPNFKDLSQKQQYEFELQVFLTGAWKKRQQYIDKLLHKYKITR